MGKDVIVVLLFWTIKKLAEGKLDQIDFPQEYAASADEVARLLKEKGTHHLRNVSEARLVGQFRVIACSAGLEYMGVDAGAVERNVDEVLGLPPSCHTDGPGGNQTVYLIAVAGAITRAIRHRSLIPAIA